MTSRVLVAGVGNIFLGDDAFGVEVVRRLAGQTGRPLPDGVRVIDFGIRGLDLAYALCDGYDAVIVVDAAFRGRPPGTLYVIEPDLNGAAAGDRLQDAYQSPHAAPAAGVPPGPGPWRPATVAARGGMRTGVPGAG